MKLTHITTALLAMGLVTGCVEVKIEADGHGKAKCEDKEKCEKAKHEENEDREERGEKEEHRDKHKEKEDREDDEKEERSSKADSKESKEAKLKKEAKLSEADARKMAMEKVPNGTIKEGELERENGHLQWSFDVAVPGQSGITEVNIDAISGQILGVARESAADEKAEAKQEKEEKEKDDK